MASSMKKGTDMASSKDHPHDYLTLQIKTEVEEEISPLSHPPEMDPTRSNLPTSEEQPMMSTQKGHQRGFFEHEISVKDETMEVEGEEDGQFVLENEAMDTEVNQGYPGGYSTPDETVWLPQPEGTGYCLICKKLCPDVFTHFTTSHSKTSALSSDVQNPNTSSYIRTKSKSWTECTYCKEVHFNISSHLISKHNATVFPYRYQNMTFNIVWTYCPICQKHYTSTRGVREHIKSYHFKNGSFNGTVEYELRSMKPYNGETTLGNVSICETVSNPQHTVNISQQKTYQNNSVMKEQDSMLNELCDENKLDTPNILLKNPPAQMLVKDGQRILKVVGGGDSNEELTLEIVHLSSVSKSPEETQNLNQTCVENIVDTPNILLKNPPAQMLVNDGQRILKVVGGGDSTTLEIVHVSSVSKIPEEIQNFKIKASNLNYNICDFCGSFYATKNDLRAHIEATHIQEHKLKCGKCDSSNCWVIFVQKYFISIDCYESHFCGKKTYKKLFSINHVLEKTGVNFCNESKVGDKFCCKICSSIFESEENLVEHVSYHVDNLQISCLKCQKSFLGCFISNQFIAVIPHKKYNFNYLKCEKCLKWFENYNLLQHHSENVHKIEINTNKTYKCVECPKVFKTPNLLTNHQLEQHNKCYCTKCCGVFINKERLKLHMDRFHSKQEPKLTAPRCNLCRYYAKTMYELYIHMAMIHLKKLDDYCPKCDRKFNSPLSLSKHNRLLHEIYKYRVKEIHNAFSKGPGIAESSTFVLANKDSQDSSPDDDQPNSSLELQRELPSCSKSNDDKIVAMQPTTALSLVKTAETSLKPDEICFKYLCKPCRSLFDDETSLADHVKEAHNSMEDNSNDSAMKKRGEEENEDTMKSLESKNSDDESISDYDKCKSCFKVLTGKIVTMSHLCIHENHAYRACNVCCQKFPTIRKADEHFRNKHNSFLKYKCEECSYAFVRPSILKAHKASKHSEVNSVYCHFCKNKFYSKHNLRAHLEKQNNIRCRRPIVEDDSPANIVMVGEARVSKDPW